ncbi:hypothetical protein A6J80_21370 (plasmid) [Paracoccus yeei]|uniref:PNPLA domain-containing protein n=1 Tax=Paracoccus yeei TaxID=147645 RepID=A0A1V0GYB3_9RHOB|nr:patatin-like phospholipase family protein [Paracoccus yeei]ARC38855.1 hypothetical protein A6J80_21370 [Paracoccus yeei]
MVQDVNFSFQGGGAYLSKMIAIADGLSHADGNNPSRHKIINLRGVAGTSAGSICAALLASNCDFTALRETLKRELEGEAKKLSGRYYGDISLVAKNVAFMRAYLGKDILDRGKLRSFIQFLLKNCPRTYQTISEYHTTDTGPTLFIARSQLHHPYLEITKEGSLIETLVDSCTIPFAFKGYSEASNNPFIDGGLCENLPVACFDPEKDVPLFSASVISEKPKDLTKMGILGYLGNLFSVATGYSVHRSREIIGDAFSITEPASFEFHEVQKSVEWFLDDRQYSDLKWKTVNRLAGFAELYRISEAGPKFLAGRNTLYKRNRDMKALTSKLDMTGAWNIENSAMIVTAHSAHHLNSTSDNTSVYRSDLIQFVSRVQALRDAPPAYKGHIKVRGNRVHPTAWKIRNITKDRGINFNAIHFQDIDASDARFDPCYLLLDNPQEDISAGDTIQVSASMTSTPGEDMSGLLDGRDFINFTNHHNDPTVTSVVLKYPRQLGRMMIQQRKIGGIHFRELTPDELQQYSWINDVEFSIIGAISSNKDGSPYEVGNLQSLSLDFVCQM